MCSQYPCGSAPAQSVVPESGPLRVRAEDSDSDSDSDLDLDGAGVGGTDYDELGETLSSVDDGLSRLRNSRFITTLVSCAALPTRSHGPSDGVNHLRPRQDIARTPKLRRESAAAPRLSVVGLELGPGVGDVLGLGHQPPSMPREKTRTYARALCLSQSLSGVRSQRLQYRPMSLSYVRFGARHLARPRPAKQRYVAVAARNTTYIQPGCTMYTILGLGQLRLARQRRGVSGAELERAAPLGSGPGSSDAPGVGDHAAYDAPAGRRRGEGAFLFAYLVLSRARGAHAPMAACPIELRMSLARARALAPLGHHRR